jgi:uncharacterized protein (DUF1778 family)
MKKDERITIRVSEKDKKDIELSANKEKMNTSEYVYRATKEKMETEKISDSQEQFISLFDIAFRKSFDMFFKQLLVVLNRIDFNSRWAIKQQDIFMQHLKVPQTKEELNLSIIDHPITEIAHEKVLKDLRTMSAKKKENEDE